MTQKFIEHLNAAVEKLNYPEQSKLIGNPIVEKFIRERIEPHKSLNESRLVFILPLVLASGSAATLP